MRCRWAAISAWAVVSAVFGVEGAFPPGRLLVTPRCLGLVLCVCRSLLTASTEIRANGRRGLRRGRCGRHSGLGGRRPGR